MQVGSFGRQLVFEVHPDKVLTPKSVKLESSATYEEHKVLGEAPRLEFLAPALKTFSFTVLLSASMGVDPSGTMEKVRELVDTGKVEQLVLGGKNYGKHVLVKATEEWSRTNGQGKPISIQATFEFKQYME